MRYRTIVPALLFSALIPITACKKSFDVYLQEAVTLGRGGDTVAAAAHLEKGLLKTTSLFSTGAPYPSCNGNVLYRLRGGRIELLYPAALSLEGPEDVRSVCIDRKTGIMAAGGKGLAVYSDAGKVIDHPDISGSRDGLVRACAWSDNSLLFYSDRRLYSYVPSTGEVATLCRDTSFPPPFSGEYYNASIEVSGTVAVISAGIAGRYHVSAVNLAGGAVLFRNREAASGRVFTDGSEVMMVTGSAGGWKITAVSLGGIRLRIQPAFTDLGNIAFFPGGLLYENDRGLWCALEGKAAPARVPGALRLYGQCGNHALLVQGATMFLVDTRTLSMNISLGREAAPGLFE